MTAVFFLYGLAFFALGLIIALYPKKQSEFRLAQNIWLIATFAILHALNEWADMFITIQKPFEISSLPIIRSFLLPLSFAFLLQFGARTITEVKNRYPALKALPVILLIIWAIIVISSNQRFLMADIGARYLLAVPGTLLTSYALMLQSAEIKKLGLSRPIAYLKLSALGFFFYGFFTGLIVPDASFFPATILNYTVFAQTIGSQVQVFRTLCALVITFGMIKALGVFDWETLEALRKSRDELEIKVKERTSDLIETNRDLEREITEREQLEDKLRILSVTDELTGLYNRRGFFSFAEQQFKIAHRSKKKMVLLSADLDDLKRINDTYGHQEGDSALIEIAEILKETFRESDFLARIGGDEFAVLQVEMADAAPDMLANRLQENLELHNSRGTRSYELSLSVGVAYYNPESPCSVGELLVEADKSMYAQKKGKKRS